MRSRRGLGVILHTKNPFGFVTHPLDCLVIKIDSIHDDIFWQGFRIQRIPMILRRDLNFSTLEIFYRLVSAPMTEFELESLSTKRLAENLMPQANSKNRHASMHQFAHFLHRITKGRRVSGAV